PTPSERAQAVLFVDVLAGPERPRLRRGPVSIAELRNLLERFVGPAQAEETLRGYPGMRAADTDSATLADSALVQHVETALAGSIGSASARLVIAAVAGDEELQIAEMIEMIDEASHVAALEERQRLARELHDSVSQALFSMTLHTRAAELALQRDGGDPD